MARHLGTLPMYSVFTFWWNFDFVIKAKRRFLCMTLIRMKARYYFRKKNCPVCIGASKRFWDIDLVWVGSGGGIPLLHVKKIFAQFSSKCYHCHSYLNSGWRLRCRGVCMLINYYACRYLPFMQIILALYISSNCKLGNACSLQFNIF